MENDLKDIYGKGEDDTKFTSPYTEHNALNALLVGAAEYNTNWADAASDNMINITINKEDLNALSVLLTYQDAKLADLVDSKEKAKYKDDM